MKKLVRRASNVVKTPLSAMHPWPWMPKYRRRACARLGRRRRDERYCGSAGGRHCVCSSNSDHSHMCATKTTFSQLISFACSSPHLLPIEPSVIRAEDSAIVVDVDRGRTPERARGGSEPGQHAVTQQEPMESPVIAVVAHDLAMVVDAEGKN